MTKPLAILAAALLLALVPAAHSVTGGAPAAAPAVAAGTTVNFGPGASLGAAGDPAVEGQWGAPISWPDVAIHVTLLNTGKVLSFRDGPSPTLWDPATGTFEGVPAGTNLFCAGHAVLKDGRAIVIGGTEFPGLGSRDTNIFSPGTEDWTEAAQMHDKRWYPTATTLADGRVLSTSGYAECYGCLAQIPEIYDADSNTWTQVPGAAAAIPTYPFMFVMGDGRVLHAGSSEVPTATSLLNVATQTWSTVDATPVDGGSATMYAPGKILKAGSSADDGQAGASASTAYVLDMNAPSPAWRQVGSMNLPRSFLNLTSLPDGSVLATGGDTTKYGRDPDTAALPAEVWSPVTEQWTLLGAMQTARLYHSMALLLPDGRVLVAGGGYAEEAPDMRNAEIFSPPYLFRGARPNLTSSPAAPVTFGSTFFAGTPDAASIASVRLIRTGSVTHSFDENARSMPLAFTQTPSGLNITAPANGNLAPPGDYMLFAVNSNGVPSVARFVRLAAGSADAVPPSAVPSLTASGGAGAVNLSWGAATDNVGVTAYNVHRSATAGFTPSLANRVAQVTGTSHVDGGMAAGTWHYRVTAQDAAGNVGSPSPQASATVTADTQAPAVAITSPTAGSTVSGVVTVTASATDNAGVAGVRFRVDGVDIGAEDTSAPYSAAWNTAAVTGPHTLTAVARDAAGNSATSAGVNVTVANGSASFGNTSSSGVNDSGDAGFINGSPAQLGTAGTLSSLSVYAGATSPGAQLRLALYANSGGPTTLIAETAPAAVSAGWNTLPAPPGVSLPAGTYWIVAQTDDPETVYRYAPGQPAPAAWGWVAQAWGAFPAAISGWHQEPGNLFAMYGTVTTGGGADSDGDGWTDGFDNCPAVPNAGQQNADREFIDLPPPKTFDDVTRADSDTAGDACDSDDDNDGVSDASESGEPLCPSATSATDPTNEDSDGDRAVDGAECAVGTDPGTPSIGLYKAPGTDSDKDGLPDAFDPAPNDVDADDDGMIDGVEFISHGTSALASDTDGDGCTDAREIASLNADRAVNSIDLSQLAQHFGLSGTPAYYGHFDVNRDARINAVDLMLVARAFGNC